MSDLKGLAAEWRKTQATLPDEYVLVPVAVHRSQYRLGARPIITAIEPHETGPVIGLRKLREEFARRAGAK